MVYDYYGLALILLVMAKKVTINGKQYTAHLYAYSKSDANEVADKLKKLGWTTSVRKTKFKSFNGITDDMYAVFKRK